METDTRPITQTEFNIYRRLTWLRIVVGIAAAVVVTLVIVSETVRENSIASCERGSGRANSEAKNWERAAQVRREGDDDETAMIYLSNVVEIRQFIAMPDGWQGEPLNRGKSTADREAGCSDAFDPIIPFIG